MKVALSICFCLIAFPFLAKGQLPFSPCSPSGGKRADVLGVETKYRAPGGAAPTFTIPTGTKSIAVYVSSETGITSGVSDYDQGDEDFITINAIIDVGNRTSSGYVNYAKNTNTDGSGTNVYGWKNAALGDTIPQASKIGDALPYLNNVKFSISGNTLTIAENANGIHSSYYVEYLSPYNNSLSPLDPQIRALLHGTTTTNTDLSIPIPTGAEIVFISAKGTNSSYTDLNTTSGTEEGYANMRFGIDLTAGTLNGFVTLANGGSVTRRSTYVVSNKAVTSTSDMVSSGKITGDYTGKLTTDGAVGLYNPKIYVSGNNLIIKRDANYARDFDDAYVVEFYSRVGLGMSTEFIDSDIAAILDGSYTWGAKRTFTIPSGTNFIYFNETGNAVNTDRESNENSLAAYGYIDLTAATVTGYFYQQVGLSGTTRRDDNYAFKNVPLDSTSTRNASGTVGFKNTGAVYDISFFLSADKSQLTVINKTGLANPSYQFLLSCDYYGSRPDVAFSTTSGISFAKGGSCNIVKATVNVCNPGSGNSSGGMPVSFYSGDPTTDPSSILLYTGTFNQDIPQGECRTFTFNLDLSSFSNVNIPLSMVLNDNGSFVSGGVGHVVGTPFTLASLANQNSKYKECYYDNNLISAQIAVNNCPVVNLDLDSSSGATKRNFINYFSAGSATGANIADNDVTVSDPDGDNISSAKIVLTNDQDGASEYLILNGTLPSGITITGANTDTIRLTGVASAAAYANALKLIQYMNTKGTPNTTTRTITVEVNDGKETGPASTTSIYILTSPRVNVTGNGSSIADNKTTTSTTDGTNYGVLTSTGGAVNATFIVQNIGTGTITLTGTPRVAISGDAGFSVTAQPSGTSITSGSGLNFVVTFNPASHAIGTYTAVVTIKNNDSNTDRASYSFTVSAVVNNLPTVSDNSVSGPEDNALTFTAANFTSVYTDPDGTALSKIRIVSLPLNGSFKLNGTNITLGQEIVAADLASIVFTPTANWNGTTSFQWNGSDGTSYATAPATMTINITPVNDAPTMSLPTGLAVTEDIPASLKDVSFADVDAGTGSVSATFTVPTGWFNAATVAGVTVTGAGTNNVTLSGTLSAINSYISGGNLTYAASHTPPATETITVVISDNGNTGAGGIKTATGTISLGITAVNDAPTGPDTNEEVNQDTELDSKVTATDLDGDAMTFAKAGNPSHGTVTVNSDGTYQYMPAAGYVGTDKFTVTVSDGHGGSSVITVNITVKKLNHAPVAVNDNYTLAEDVPYTGNVLTNDTDVDGDALTASLIVAPVKGTVVLNADGSFTYTPDADYNGLDSLKYRVCDNGSPGMCDTGTVIFTVTAVNDAPVAVNDAVTVTEDTPATGNVLTNDTDVEGDALTASLLVAPVNGTVVLNADGSFTYTPNADYNGLDSLKYRVCDNGSPSMCDTGTVIFTVTAVNDNPSGSNTTETTNEDTPLNSHVTATDVDGDVMTYSKGTDPAHGTVVVNSDGTYTYTPAADYNGPDSFTIALSDGKGGTGSITVNITVNPVNDNPTGPNTTETTNEDTPLNSHVTATDVDGDVVTYSKGTDPAHGTVVVNSDGTYTYTPAADYNGPDSFTVALSDGKGGTGSITVNITVNPVNDNPTGPNTTETTNEDTPLNSHVTATDVDGDVVTYSKGTDPAHGTVVVNSDGTYTYTPAANYNGPDSFTVALSDGKGGTGIITVNITVNPVNDNPTGSNTTEVTNEDTPLNSHVTATDVDGDVVTYSKGTDPAHGTVVVNSDGTYTYTPAANYNGPDSFTVALSDGKGGTGIITVNITVNPVNDNPTGSNTTEVTNEDTPLNSHVTATDVDGDVVTYSKGTDPAHGTVVVNSDGTYTYTPAADYNGPDSFTVALSDGKGGTGSITVNITVNPVNDNPTGPNTTEVTNEDTPLNSHVSATDVDGDVVTYSKGTDPAHGTVVVNSDGTYTYTPAADYNGPDSFTVALSDGKGGTGSITVNITVNPVNDNPTGPNTTETTNEDTPLNSHVTATDVDGDVVTYSKGTDPAHGTVVVNSDGTYTYTPAADYNGPDSFTVALSDGKGGTGSITVNITVNPVNDNP
uniref:tandem-95 repeat protein n=1 Tax=Chitinophaga sp. TaxID=1869181 RepID=UPI0031D78178